MLRKRILALDKDRSKSSQTAIKELLTSVWKSLLVHHLESVPTVVELVPISTQVFNLSLLVLYDHICQFMVENSTQ